MLCPALEAQLTVVFQANGDAMPRRIDHLVICVRDLAQAEPNLRTLGFTLTPTSAGAVVEAGLPAPPQRRVARGRGRDVGAGADGAPRLPRAHDGERSRTCARAPDNRRDR